jgi:hypothetical protein
MVLDCIHKINDFIFPNFRVNPHDLDNQKLYIEAERLNFERGKKFWLDAFKFFITALGLIIGFLTFVSQASKDSANTLNNQFVELSNRVIASKTPQETTNAIASLEILVLLTNKI